MKEKEKIKLYITLLNDTLGDKYECYQELPAKSGSTAYILFLKLNL